jgi:hypothetical protein
LEAPTRFYLDPNYSTGTFRAFMGDVLELSGLKSTNITPSNPVMINFGDPYVVSYPKAMSANR